MCRFASGSVLLGSSGRLNALRRTDVITWIHVEVIEIDQLPQKMIRHPPNSSSGASVGTTKSTPALWRALWLINVWHMEIS